MGTKTIAGIEIQVNDEGYMMDASQWTPEVASALAKEEGIELTDKHMEVLNFIREEFNKGNTLTIRKVGKSGIVDIKGFYELFPGGPLKKASKIAGISKPSSCV